MSVYRFALRTDGHFEKVKSFVESKGFSGYAVREVADDNEHWHWFLEGNVKPNSFRVLLKRSVPEFVGNGSYSVKQCDADVERYHRYCLKGEGSGAGYEVVWRNGLLWTDERFEELHRGYWEEHDKAKKQRERGSIVDVVLEECRRTAVKYDNRNKIAELYIRECVRRKKAINKFLVKSQCLLITTLLCPDDTAIVNLAAEVWL